MSRLSSIQMWIHKWVGESLSVTMFDSKMSGANQVHSTNGKTLNISNIFSVKLTHADYVVCRTPWTNYFNHMQPIYFRRLYELLRDFCLWLQRHLPYFRRQQYRRSGGGHSGGAAEDVPQSRGLRLHRVWSGSHALQIQRGPYDQVHCVDTL